MSDVHVSEQDGIAVIQLDDGKMNALSREMIADAEAAIEALGDDPFVLTGNDNALSAGLDRKVFEEGESGVIDLMLRFGALTRTVFLHPGPVVVAAAGHAIAGGTFLAMSADWTIAADGDGTWGMTETAIGMTLPSFAVAQARYRLKAGLVDRLVLGGRSLTPREALGVGLVDAVVDPVKLLPEAVDKAKQLAKLPRRSYGATKRRLRGHLVETDEAAARDDLEDYFASSPIFDAMR